MMIKQETRGREGDTQTQSHTKTPGADASNSVTLEESNTVMCISGYWNGIDIQSNVGLGGDGNI